MHTLKQEETCMHPSIRKIQIATLFSVSNKKTKLELETSSCKVSINCPQMSTTPPLVGQPACGCVLLTKEALWYPFKANHKGSNHKKVQHFKQLFVLGSFLSNTKCQNCNINSAAFCSDSARPKKHGDLSSPSGPAVGEAAGPHGPRHEDV